MSNTKRVYKLSTEELNELRKSIKFFRKRVKIVLKNQEGKKNLEQLMGLCKELSTVKITGDKYTYSSSYGMMRQILTDKEYSDGLGPKGVYTKERKNFLEFIDSLSYDDLYRIIKPVHEREYGTAQFE